MDTWGFRDCFHIARLRFDSPHHTDNRCGVIMHYFGYMRQGKGRLLSDERELHVTEGDLFYIPRGLSYQSWWSGDPQCCFDSYGFTFLPEGEEIYPLQRIEKTPALAALLDRLGDRELGEDSGTLGLFFLLFSEARGQMERRAVGRAHATVTAALAYMESAQELHVPTVARHCRVSESGLYAAFRAEKGCTPLACYHRLLADRAVHLLQSTDLSVEEIAERLGFCSPAYFRRLIRRETGKTPREIRRTHLP